MSESCSQGQGDDARKRLVFQVLNDPKHKHHKAIRQSLYRELPKGDRTRVLDEDDEYGSIEPGKLAELVVIEGDPVARPAEIRNARIVFKGGLGYDTAKLIESAEGQVGIR